MLVQPGTELGKDLRYAERQLRVQSPKTLRIVADLLCLKIICTLHETRARLY